MGGRSEQPKRGGNLQICRRDRCRAGGKPEKNRNFHETPSEEEKNGGSWVIQKTEEE